MDNELKTYLNKICFGELKFDDNKLFEICFNINPELKDKISDKSKKRMKKGNLPYLIKAMSILLYYKYHNTLKVGRILNKDHSTVIHHINDIKSKCLSDRIYDKELYNLIFDITKSIVTKDRTPHNKYWKINNIMAMTFHNMPLELINDIKWFVNKKLKN